MTRIRYTKKDNTLVTELLTLGPNLIVRGVIRPGFTAEVVTVEGQTIDLISANNTRQAKDLLRKSLVSLGLRLDSEIRNKPTTP